MKYHDTRGYKYTLAETISVDLPLMRDGSFATAHFSLRWGRLTIRAGYAWDGASGPTWDTPATMVPSLVHDALYQAIRAGLLPRSARFDADLTFYRLMRARASGILGYLRALYFFLGVRLGGGLALRFAAATEPQDRELFAT